MNMTRIRNILPSALIGSSLVASAGCSVSMGGKTGNATCPPTVGQQLIDLQKARDAGAVTPAEYQTVKVKLLDEN